jgi:hypothetical protein
MLEVFFYFKKQKLPWNFAIGKRMHGAQSYAIYKLERFCQLISISEN